MWKCKFFYYFFYFPHLSCGKKKKKKLVFFHILQSKMCFLQLLSEILKSTFLIYKWKIFHIYNWKMQCIQFSTFFIVFLRRQRPLTRPLTYLIFSRFVYRSAGSYYYIYLEGFRPLFRATQYILKSFLEFNTNQT